LANVLVRRKPASAVFMSTFFLQSSFFPYSFR
jgi:hypothetical protein